MSMTYKQNLKLSLWDKLVFGLIVVIASAIGNATIEKIKLLNSESLKSVDSVVKYYEEYSLALDNHRYQLEELDRGKDYVEMLELFGDVNFEEHKAALNKVESLSKAIKINQVKLHNLLRSSDVKIGRQLQGHLLNGLSYLVILHDAKDSLRKARKREIEWSINNSTVVIEEMENNLRSMRLSIFQIREFAINWAMP